jgi:hypothetical protein
MMLDNEFNLFFALIMTIFSFSHHFKHVQHDSKTVVVVDKFIALIFITTAFKLLFCDEKHSKINHARSFLAGLEFNVK